MRPGSLKQEIRMLDAVTVGQIAAGEVIERPASIVKELVENAVDAGASRITVSVERGGTDVVEVMDDGYGIPAAQLSLAACRHATSKISSADDLEAVSTLGFRGEGLASIAAVCELQILSRIPSEEVGALVRVHAQRSTAVEPAAAPVGTRVRASALFAELPVRREYLRSSSSEFARISGFLSAFALAYPAIAFTLRHDGKDVWVMPASEDLRERLAMVFGREAAGALIPLGEADSSIGGELRGFISAPGHDRPDRRMQLLFVNGRLLRSTIVAGAWSGGYATYSMVGRQPFGVLFLDLPPESVDANVHPTKSDVRLRYPAQVADGVRRTIAATLRDHANRRLQQSVSHDGPLGATPAAGVAVSFLDRAFPDDVAVAGSRLRVLGQIARTYVLASDGESLLLIDQHAAHERIAYEAMAKRAERKEAGEPLLVPNVVELDAAQSEILEGMLEALNDGGLEVERFGEHAYRVTATPAGYRARRFDLRAVIEDLALEGKGLRNRERVWASLACHSVTVAGEPLELEEMIALVERLQTCENPMHCPHGRPTMIRLGASDLAKMFKRT
jgi:DNA mismatch repair protein MutL